MEIYEYFRQAWRPTKRGFYEAESDSSFYLQHKFPDEDMPQGMKDHMPEENNIRDVTQSRDELRVCGNGATSHNIMKAGDPEVTKLIRYIVKATVRHSRVMDSGKQARTILI
jgi:hypothetical protein